MIIIWILAFVVAITIHEASHAWMADRLGDPTARLNKRLTLNPIPHIDIYGSLIVPILLLILRSPFVFGWAKPVPVDPYNFKNPRKDSALVSFAGPLSNLSLALILSIIARFLPFSIRYIVPFVQVNIIIAIFNLIPIHPLDGSKILIGILPKKYAYQVESFLNRFGVILLFLLILPSFGGTSFISRLISPVINLFYKILLPQLPLV